MFVVTFQRPSLCKFAYILCSLLDSCVHMFCYSFITIRPIIIIIDIIVIIIILFVYKTVTFCIHAYSFSSFPYFFVPCGKLSWLRVSFWAHLNTGWTKNWHNFLYALTSEY